MSIIHELSKYGQSIWYDNIRRAMLVSGDLQNLVDLGVTGVTSNPTIFEKAIVGSSDYDADLQALTAQGYDTDLIYETLVLDDIRSAADVLRPVYDRTVSKDGYISLEVRPTLAKDAASTIVEARRLFATLGRPNVMIKVPATPQGIPAITTLISEGINVNVTLIFSLNQYEAVAEAYIAGLEKRTAAREDISKIASVASFFISRVDGLADLALGKAGVSELQGKTAIANAKVAYARFLKLFEGQRWEKLAERGAQVQRPLWASTGTKNLAYPDTLYVDALIGPHTVNTVPPAALDAYLDHGNPSLSLAADVDKAIEHLAHVEAAGISLSDITDRLLDDGLSAFVKSFEALLSGIAEKKSRLQSGWSPLTANLGGYTQSVANSLQVLKRDRIIKRIWALDHTVWKPEPKEITNRLGWLDIANRMVDVLPRITNLVDSLRQEGFTQVVLLGMGGSSLAPEMFRRTFGVKEGFLDLLVLDNTDPGAIVSLTDCIDLERTLFIVSTKSGTTPETLSFFKYFYNKIVSRVGKTKAGEHFIAITDPGSKLTDIAFQFGFRDIFENDPNIGGRYSALSYFGLVPAGVIGVDLAKLLDRAVETNCNCASCNCAVNGDNQGAYLGTLMGELAKSGRDKITFVFSPEIQSFGDWVEQLIAESTGKEGLGILPVVGEALGEPVVYGDDRLFVHIRLEGDSTYDIQMQALAEHGHPLVTLRLRDCYDLGQQFYLWEMATAVAGYWLGINPFDQPNVESAKILTRKMLEAYHKDGQLEQPKPVLEEHGVSVYGDITAGTLTGALQQTLSQTLPGAYIAIQAYIQPSPEIDSALNVLRIALRDETQMATTLGYGPRFLHSTGQLHKGDAGKGVFIQLTAKMSHDVLIPDEAGIDSGTMSFGILKMAQVLGDCQALRDVGRKVYRIDLGSGILENLKHLSEVIL